MGGRSVSNYRKMRDVICGRPQIVGKHPFHFCELEENSLAGPQAWLKRPDQGISNAMVIFWNTFHCTWISGSEPEFDSPTAVLKDVVGEFRWTVVRVKPSRAWTSTGTEITRRISTASGSSPEQMAKISGWLSTPSTWRAPPTTPTRTASIMLRWKTILFLSAVKIQISFHLGSKLKEMRR